MPELWDRSVCTFSLKWTHQKIPKGLERDDVLLEHKLEKLSSVWKPRFFWEREVKYSHLKTYTFSAQLCLCNKGPFPPDLLGTLAIFHSLYGFNKPYFSPLGQQKNLPCSHHAWPSFVFLPHYSKKTSQARALQSAHLSLPILLFPGKASPTARCSQRRNPLLSFWELPLTKKQAVTNHGLYHSI